MPARLAAGEFDAFFSDTLEAPHWLAQLDDGARALPPFTRDRKAWLVRSDRSQLAALLDHWLLAREADGTLEARLDLAVRTTSAGWTRDGRVIFAAVGKIFVLPLDTALWGQKPEILLKEAEQAAGVMLSELLEVGRGRSGPRKK